MHFGTGTLYALIISCEIGFWLALCAGLTCRYLLGRPALGKLLLAGVSLIDLALLALTVVDLRSGATATFAHGLAVAYVAFTIAFGPTMMRRADTWFAHRFAGGPPPASPSSRLAAMRVELKLWGLCLLAVGIVYLLLTILIMLVDQPDRTQALLTWYRIPLGTAFFWFLFGPVWTLLLFKRR